MKIRKNTSRILAVGALFELLLSNIIPVSSVFAAAPLNPQNFGMVQINGASSLEDKTNEDTIEATFEHGTLTASGTGLYSDGNNMIYVPAGTNITLEATGAHSYDGNLISNGIDQHSPTMTLNNVQASTGPVANVDVAFTKAPTQATINYSYDGAGRAERFLVNGAEFNYGEATPGQGNTDESGFFTGSVGYEYESGTVAIEFETLFISRITTLTINNTDYTSSLPSTPEQILNAINNQFIRVAVNVPYAASYDISTTTAENRDEYMVVGNFLWSYMDKDKGTDDYMGGGKFEFVSLEYNGTKYNSVDELMNAGKGYFHWGEGENEGGALLPYGATLTARLLPNPGYQLTSFTINGGTFDPQEEVGVYSFTIERGNFHLGASFTQVEDAVSASADGVESGSIDLGDNELDYGTAVLEVEEADLSEEDIAEFTDAAGDYEVATYLDISLYQVTYKGTADATDAWKDQLQNLGKEVTITLQLEEGVDGNEIVIVHQKHDGTYEIIPTVYDPVAHTITFKTSSFSNYAIASRTVESPDTGAFVADGASAKATTGLAAVFVFTALAFVVVSKRSLR